MSKSPLTPKRVERFPSKMKESVREKFLARKVKALTM